MRNGARHLARLSDGMSYRRTHTAGVGHSGRWALGGKMAITDQPDSWREVTARAGERTGRNAVAGCVTSTITSGAAWNMQIRKRVQSVCDCCGAQFMALLKQVKKGKGRCCSHSCAARLASVNRNQQGPANNNWKGDLADRSNRARKQRYRAKNPEKHAAHLLMRNAIRRGELVRSACEICGSGRVEGHHDDYAKPLDVRWLCKKHHLQAHGGRLT